MYRKLMQSKQSDATRFEKKKNRERDSVNKSQYKRRGHLGKKKKKERIRSQGVQHARQGN